jgi:hypothetical protein
MAEHDPVIRNETVIGGTGDPRRIATSVLRCGIARGARSAPNR